MRSLAHLERFRLKDDYMLRTFGSYGDDYNGFFIMPSPVNNEPMKVFASDGTDAIGPRWDHVSVSKQRRIPTWIEMCHVKDLCFDPEDCVVQFHVPKSQYVNYHPHCLHLWRPYDYTLVLPPSHYVGPIGVERKIRT